MTRAVPQLFRGENASAEADAFPPGFSGIFQAAENGVVVEYYLIEQEGSRFPELEGVERCLANWKHIKAETRQRWVSVELCYWILSRFDFLGPG